jgi:hypothetical protein
VLYAEASITNFAGIIFAFKSMSEKTILRQLTGYYTDPLHRPLAILLMDKGIVIHQVETNRSIIDTQFGGSDAPYEVRKAKDKNNKETFVLTYLFLLFLQAQAEYIGAFHLNDIYTAMSKLNEEYSNLL